jgi:hypothetical protein
MPAKEIADKLIEPSDRASEIANKLVEDITQSIASLETQLAQIERQLVLHKGAIDAIQLLIRRVEEDKDVQDTRLAGAVEPVKRPTKPVSKRSKK